MSGFPPQSPPLPATVLAPLVSARAGRRSAAAAGTIAQHDRVLDDDLFRDALARECRRSDRYEEPFVVALVSRDERRSSTAWEDIFDALSSPRFEGDIVGWSRRGAELGLIRTAGLPTPGESGHGASMAVLHDVQDGLADLVDGCDVRVEAYDPKAREAPPLFFSEMERTPRLTDVARSVGKRAFDIVGSVMLLVLLAPLMLCVALAVMASSPGPVLFRQRRIGRDGRLFKMLKFRTMHVDADPAVHEQYVERFIEAGASRPSGSEIACKIVNDPRVTALGHWLRRSSLDELPQLWNVLVGDMSLVGPRPPLPCEVVRYKSWHRRRVLEAIPGMTGLWQVTGRSQTSFDEMVRIDLRYARTWSLWTDVRILVATLKAVISGRGAY